MDKTKKFSLLLSLAMLAATAEAQEPRFSADKTIWYTAPAKDWNTQALHIGNGYMGASFYGGVETEHFDMSEETFWTGKPGERICLADGSEPGGRERLREIQREVAGGNYAKADALTARYISSDRRGFGYFSNVGRLSLRFKGQEGDVSGYRRGVETTDGFGFVSYRRGDTDYRRTYFCSYPDKVMAVRLTASRPGCLSLDIAHSFTHPAESPEFDGKGLWTVTGKIADNGQRYAVRLLVDNKGEACTLKTVRFPSKRPTKCAFTTPSTQNTCKTLPTTEAWTL